MARCAVCTEKVVLPSKLAIGRRKLRTWSSCAELISLARAGCDFCLLIWQHISCYYTRHFLQYIIRIPSEIKLALKNERNANGLRKTVVSIWIRFKYYPIGDLKKQRLRRAELDFPGDTHDAMAQARSLLDNCLSSHEGCDKPPIFGEVSPSLPRRLLDLSRGCTILIVDVDTWISQGLASAAELSQYCTLSYRWGSTAHDCTLKAPFSTQIELALDSMPQTFKDAISTARALNMRFLWIDALCIVQPSACGDNTDWNTEGPRMGTIYHGAVFTIAATCASSTDDGFLAKVGATWSWLSHVTSIRAQ